MQYIGIGQRGGGCQPFEGVLLTGFRARGEEFGSTDYYYESFDRCVEMLNQTAGLCLR